MSGWAPVSDEEREQYECFRFERLISDDGKVLGSVMQFYEGAAAYPIGIRGRLGAHSTFETGKLAVEKELEKS